MRGKSWYWVESVEKAEVNFKDFPKILEGEGFGIIEDCGGVSGLADLANAFKMKKGEQYLELSLWLGVDTLDLKTFDLEDMKFRLKKMPKIYKEIYEYDHEVTQKEIDLFERKYKDKLSRN